MDSQNIIRSVGALEEAVKNLAQVAIRMEDKSTDAQEAVHERLDDLKDEIGELVSRVDALCNKMDHVYPIVTKFEENYQRSIGAKHMGKFIWGAAISTIGLIIAASTHIIDFWHAHVVP